MKTFEEEILRDEYTVKEKTNIDEALKLDRKCKLPAYVLAYALGIFGTLVLGIGMCLAMQVIGEGTGLFVGGIILGIIGIIIICINYPLFLKVMKLRKEKYSSAILVLLNKKED